MAVTFLRSLQHKIPEYWIASIASVQYGGTSEMTKSATDRSPARMPGESGIEAGAKQGLEAGHHKVGASEVNSAS